MRTAIAPAALTATTLASSLASTTFSTTTLAYALASTALSTASIPTTSRCATCRVA